MTEELKIKRALISVSDKTGVAELALKLKEYGAEIISTGGTAAMLRENKIEVTDVADVTGFPEMMDGRVKTLHPKIHGAFLALRDDEGHQKAATDHGIQMIDMVVVKRRSVVRRAKLYFLRDRVGKAVRLKERRLK